MDGVVVETEHRTDFIEGVLVVDFLLRQAYKNSVTVS